MYIAQTLIRTGFGLSNNLLRCIFQKVQALMAKCISIWIEEVGAV